MFVTSLLMVSFMGASAVTSEATRWFPGDYFNTRVRGGFQAEVMESWPGPGQLLMLWKDGELDEAGQVSLLLGGAAFHDPLLLPAYRDAMTSSSVRVRQAAVYGYRDLLADLLPDVQGGISDEVSALLGEEMDLVAQTLSQRSLLEMWLQALLNLEGINLPGWSGVTLRRPSDVCLQAVERLADVEDLSLLLVAYDLSTDFATRINLLKLVEGVTLSRFLVMPDDPKEGWGPHVYRNAIGAMANARRRWTREGCVVNGEDVLVQNLAAMGVTGIDPLSIAGCGVWLGVLDQGAPQWWAMATRRLYECGGPWLEIQALAPEREPGPSHRTRLLEWYRPLMPKGRRQAPRR